jgi:hypothetical protein
MSATNVLVIPSALKLDAATVRAISDANPTATVISFNGQIAPMATAPGTPTTTPNTLSHETVGSILDILESAVNTGLDLVFPGGSLIARFAEKAIAIGIDAARAKWGTGYKERWTLSDIDAEVASLPVAK